MTTSSDATTHSYRWAPWYLRALILLGFYSLMVVQPVISDEWCPPTNQLIQWSIAKIPYSGQRIQVVFGAYGLLTVSPFSLFRPWTFMGTSFVALLLWRAVGLQNPYARASFNIHSLTWLSILCTCFSGSSRKRRVHICRSLDVYLDIGISPVPSPNNDPYLELGVVICHEFHYDNLE